MLSTALVWIRNDLRVRDHAPLRYAADHYDQVIPVYCFDPRHFGTTMFDLPKMSSIRARFLRESVQDLRDSVQDLGADLVVRRGRPEDILPELVRQTGANEVLQFQEIGGEEEDVETAVEDALRDTGATPGFFWGKTLYHIDDVPFDGPDDIPKVYTNFRKAVEKKSTVRPTLDAPDSLLPLPEDLNPGSIPTLDELGFDDDGTVDERGVLPFRGGESRGHDRINEYIWRGDFLKKYKATRNGLLGANYSAKFSAWLAHGCITPRQIHEEVERYEDQRVDNKSTYWMKFELIWRDFFSYVTWKAGERLFRPGGINGNDIDWRYYDESFERWAAGTTGIPFVDANMRELNRTGYMSNRGRQNVASMLSQSLKLDWRMGAAYFESRLVDYDVASNWGNWAYNSRVGNDPRARYFNIVKQAKRYDENGEYVRYWLPELADVPDKYVHEPHRMSHEQQKKYGCVLGADYPKPVVDLDKTYQRIRNERG
ncbi:deoxyribodipyrimidine photo-lyase [Salinibacter ruber]|uniref:Cryptochrome DASH n=1 Tax=Salinibacter ruber TaxID=146919 RepID=A0AAW5P9F6_9BACT|nr:deoxyribodipyrimidine photo-lyase [Salinibacter ruber]MCS4158049.1 deoxyribodipyrimidine photo-lyase [Salinibacter ruber]MCS4221670.1 deoxyribodipyrimidine photo-lyase [Salinibacter ruber]